MLKTMITFIVATVLGALGNAVAGMTGALIGSLAGMIIGWWAAKRLTPT